jgi:HSP20 family protein
MAYLTFYNPYFHANRDEKSDATMDQMNRCFGNGSCVPASNVYETDTEYRLEIALPGVEKEKIKVKHENGLLSVSVDKREETTENYSRREFDYAGSSRVFKTGEKVNGDNISAVFENGVLKITLPKREAFVKKPAQEIAVN